MVSFVLWKCCRLRGGLTQNCKTWCGAVVCVPTPCFFLLYFSPKERCRNMREGGRMEQRLSPQTPTANFWPCLETFWPQLKKQWCWHLLEEVMLREALKSEDELATHEGWGGKYLKEGCKSKVGVCKGWQAAWWSFRITVMPGETTSVTCY